MNKLAFWYQVIIASETLLKEAAFLLVDEGFEGKLKKLYEDHLQEEMDHARWLREDIGDYPINLHFGAAQLAGMAYYLIRHVHPVALMGYMLALEGGKIDPNLISKLEKEHGSKAVRTLRLHADKDPHHFAELLSFPIPEQWQPLVENTRLQTIKLVEVL